MNTTKMLSRSDILDNPFWFRILGSMMKIVLSVSEDVLKTWESEGCQESYFDTPYLKDYMKKKRKVLSKPFRLRVTSLNLFSHDNHALSNVQRVCRETYEKNPSIESCGMNAFYIGICLGWLNRENNKMNRGELCESLMLELKKWVEKSILYAIDQINIEYELGYLKEIQNPKHLPELTLPDQAVRLLWNRFAYPLTIMVPKYQGVF